MVQKKTIKIPHHTSNLSYNGSFIQIYPHRIIIDVLFMMDTDGLFYILSLLFVILCKVLTSLKHHFNISFFDSMWRDSIPRKRFTTPPLLLAFVNYRWGRGCKSILWTNTIREWDMTGMIPLRTVGSYYCVRCTLK